MGSKRRRAWLIGAVVVVGVIGAGWGLDAVLRAQPRCTIRGPNLIFGPSADGATLTTCELDPTNEQGRFKSLKVWNTTNGSERAHFSFEANHTLVDRIGFSPDRRFHARLSDETLSIVDLHAVHESAVKIPRTEFGPTFSTHGAFVVVIEPGDEHHKTHVIECSSGAVIATLRAHSMPVERWPFTRNDELLVYFADVAGKPLLTAWSTGTRQVVHTFPAIDAASSPVLHLAPDGRTLIVLTLDGMIMCDLVSGQTRTLSDCSPDWSKGFAFSADGSAYAIVVGKDVHVIDLRSGRLNKRIENAWWAPDRWNWLWLTPEGRDLAMVGDGTLKVRDVETGRQTWRSQMRPGEDYPELTPEHGFLVDRNVDGGRIDIVDLADGRTRGSIALDGGKPAALLKFTPDGRLLVAHFTIAKGEPGLAERWLGAWWPWPSIERYCVMVAELPTGRQRRAVCLASGIYGWELSADGGTLATSQFSDDGETIIQCWDVPQRSWLGLTVGVPLALLGLAVLVRRRLARSDAKTT